MMTELLQQLPNGGAVVAIIVVTWIFLKKQERYEDKMDTITKYFVSEIALARKEYLAQIQKLTREK
jgi:hypothetical protein